MPSPEELHEHADRLRTESEELRGAAAQLRDVSRRILAAMDELKRLERHSRTLPVGSREFELVSAEIEVQAKAIYGMASQQRTLGEVVPPVSGTIDELDGET